MVTQISVTRTQWVNWLMPTIPKISGPLVAPQVVVMATYGATRTKSYQIDDLLFSACKNSHLMPTWCTYNFEICISIIIQFSIIRCEFFPFLIRNISSQMSHNVNDEIIFWGPFQHFNALSRMYAIPKCCQQKHLRMSVLTSLGLKIPHL